MKEQRESSLGTDVGFGAAVSGLFGLSLFFSYTVFFPPLFPLSSSSSSSPSSFSSFSFVAVSFLPLHPGQEVA